jgi:hypothetical protein
MMRKLIYLISLFTSALHAQQIVTLNNYQPVQLIGDTLFINREGYDIVKVVKPNTNTYTNRKYSKHKFTATYYLLPTDSINPEEGLALLQQDLLSSMKRSNGFKKNKCLVSYGADDYNLFNTLEITCKNCDWTFPVSHWVVDKGFEKLQVENPYVLAPSHLFPGFMEALDSIALLLQYGENQNYYIRFVYENKMNVEINVSDECSNYQQTKVPESNTEDMEKYLENLRWPVLKIDSKVMPYSMSFSFNYGDIMEMKAEKEIKNGFKTPSKYSIL